MSKRDPLDAVNDILEEIEHVERYTKEQDYESFMSDSMRYQATEKAKKRKKQESYKRKPLHTHPQQNALWN